MSEATTSKNTSPVVRHQQQYKTSISTDTSKTTASGIVFDHERINLDSHQLVWLDANVNNNDHSNSAITIANLRQIIDYTKLFDTMEGCQQFLEKKTNTSMTFLIASGQFGEILIPKIHQLENVLIIYIYCQNKDYHQRWASKYPKIKQVHTVLSALLDDLKKDVDSYLKAEKIGLVNSSVKSENSTTHVFAWWKYIPRVLIHLPYTAVHRHQFIACLKAYYAGKHVELGILDEFENEYSPDKAIWWYTRETFLYRLLNRALRQQNIELILLFGFFLQDLYRQFQIECTHFKEQQKENPILKCYRGQVMSSDETEQLLRDGSLVVNSCLFSTSLDRDVSMFFLKNAPVSGGMQRVLLEIEIDVWTYSDQFADISHLSDMPNESEILFMIGTPLRTKSHYYNSNEKITIIQIKTEYVFSFDIDAEYLEVTNPRKTLLNCLRKLYPIMRWQMLPNDIELLFNELFHYFPHERQWMLAMQYLSPGKRDASKEPNAHGALEYHEKALQILLDYVNDDELNCCIDIVSIYAAMRELYKWHLKNIDMVEKCQNLAVTYAELALKQADSDYEKMTVHRILSDMFKTSKSYSCDDTEKRETYLLHLKHNELEIDHRLKCRPCSQDNFQMFADTIIYPKIADLYRALGHRYLSIYKYSEALATFDKVLALYLANHQDRNFLKIVNFIPTMVETSFKMNDGNSALKYQLIAHETTLKFYHSSHNGWDKEKIAKSYIELSDVYMKLKQYNLALENLEIAIMKYKETGHDTLQKINWQIQSFARDSDVLKARQAFARFIIWTKTIMK